MSFSRDDDDDSFVFETRLPLDRYDNFELTGEFLYMRYFAGNDHANFVAKIDDRYFVVSVLEQPVTNRHPARYLFIIRTTEYVRTRTVWIGGLSSASGGMMFSCCRPSVLSEAFARLSLSLDRFVLIREGPDIEKTLLDCEQSFLRSYFKCGIMLQTDDLSSENQILANCVTTPNFEEFLEFMGEKVVLKGFQGFSGGLDVRNDRHGTHAFHAEYEGNEIMFHVSTLLPFSEKDAQQLMRKRHIGNDPDGDDPYPIGPSFFRSKMTYSKILVWVNETKYGKYWKVAIFNRMGMEPFAPRILSPSVFRDARELVTFLYQKIICASRAAWKAQAVDEKSQNYREGVFRQLWEESAGTVLSSPDRSC